ncbi:helix-turn-helix domain-containing protein [Nocardia sp. NPDC004151]|uniref:helix-turn-helix domain-containing protein n=1 Tax=Nocardia sp. NPDC004151 TaxID=3364304 RepID=UPI0036CD4253
MIEDSAGVAARVAEARKLRGWSQQRLAAETRGAGTPVSLGLIQSVEQGKRAATPAFVAACAKALRITAAELLGQPYMPSTAEDREVHAAIALLRTEMAAWDMEDPDIAVRPIATLSRDVLAARKLRRDASSPKLAAVLPSLMTETRTLMYRSVGNDREQVGALLAELYYNARSMAHKLGYPDLAAIAVDRMTWAANESGDNLWIAAAQFHRASLLTSGGDWKTAMTYLERCRTEFENRLGVGDESDLIAWGGLHLQSGLAAARGGRRDLVDMHLIEATETADRLRSGDSDEILVFGPTNVGIWGVALAVESLDSATAIRRADKLYIPTETPRSRSGHHYIDLARAYQLQGSRDRVMGSLMTARALAPSMVRFHPMVHETVRMMAREDARRTDSVRGFAAWCGIAL